MNILIPDSWLREHLKTKATPKKIAESLSLCSQSVEKVTKLEDDWLYEIEVTTNRPDCLSIRGLARELAAILPRFKVSTQLKPFNLKKNFLAKVKNPLSLNVKITKSSLCPRFAALIFDHIKVKPSPKTVQERLEKSGIRALNNVVDISNYLMLELGQPMHTFDYDKIKGAKIILREAKEGEKIITLDGITRNLPEGTIIIEDGEGRIIDLCGIMGGENSAVDENTQRVLLFVQTYDPQKIRQGCQKMAFRTEASSRFEKGVDSEGVILAMKKAIKMFQKICDASIASNLIDLYPHPPQPKKIQLDTRLVNKIMGIKINKKEITNLLESLGFKIKPTTPNSQLTTITVPLWRHDDISLPEDLIEEIARLYGYHNLPSQLMATQIPEGSPDRRFFWEKKIKDFLSHQGLTETMSCSLQGQNLIEKCHLNPIKYLKLKNPLSQDLVFLRGSLIPSLLQIMAENQAHFENIKIFEIAHIYLKKAKDLPEEKAILSGATLGKDKFYEVKGVVEALLGELEIIDTHFSPPTTHYPLWHPTKTAIIYFDKQFLGVIGEIHPQVLTNFEIKNPVVIFNLDFDLLTQLATTQKAYQSLPKFPSITEDLCFLVPPQIEVGKLIQLIKQVSKIITSVELIDSFKDQRTFRITFQHPKKTLEEKEVEKIRKKIIKILKEKARARIKTK